MIDYSSIYIYIYEAKHHIPVHTVNAINLFILNDICLMICACITHANSCLDSHTRASLR